MSPRGALGKSAYVRAKLSFGKIEAIDAARKMMDVLCAAENDGSLHKLKAEGRIPYNRPLAFGGDAHTEDVMLLEREGDTPLGKALRPIFKRHNPADSARWGHPNPRTVVQAWLQLGYLAGAYESACPLWPTPLHTSAMSVYMCTTPKCVQRGRRIGRGSTIAVQLHRRHNPRKSKSCHAQWGSSWFV
jgi:hypothetical protein